MFGKYLGSIEDMEGLFGFGSGGGAEVDAVSPCGLRSISVYVITIRVEFSILSSRDFLQRRATGACADIWVYPDALINGPARSRVTTCRCTVQIGMYVHVYIHACIYSTICRRLKYRFPFRDLRGR